MREVMDKRWMLAALILAVVLSEGALLGWYGAEANTQRQKQLEYQQQERVWRACLGLTPGATAEEQINAVEDCLDEQRKLVQMEPAIILNLGGRGTLSVANSSESKLRYRVSIRLLDTGEEIYQSGLLEPGYLLLQMQTDARLESGIYPCVVLFEGFPMEADIAVGTFAKTAVMSVSE